MSLRLAIRSGLQSVTPSLKPLLSPGPQEPAQFQDVVAQAAAEPSPELPTGGPSLRTSGPRTGLGPHCKQEHLSVLVLGHAGSRSGRGLRYKFPYGPYKFCYAPLRQPTVPGSEALITSVNVPGRTRRLRAAPAALQYPGSVVLRSVHCYLGAGVSR
jgi:hypothetical protein